MALIPERDEQYLKAKEFKYELTQVNAEIHLILRDVTFPAAYAVRSADVLIKIPPGYPLVRLDMFYTHPEVRLLTGAFPAAADQVEPHSGRTWQRWSRHHDWRAGIDDLRSFIAAIGSEISKGI